MMGGGYVRGCFESQYSLFRIMQWWEAHKEGTGFSVTPPTVQWRPGSSLRAARA